MIPVKMARVASGEIVSGRLGGRVYRDFSGEGFVSAAPATVNPQTQKQMDARARLALAVALWRELSLDAMDRWRAYAAQPAPFPTAKGRKRSSRGDLAFRGLAAKYLQVHGGSVVPTEPPASPFFGDGVVVSVAAAPTGITFSSSGPNSAGVLTELLVQRLAARHRKPHPDEYRTQRFVAFAGAPITLPASSGAYACAIRFVRSGTGQASAMVELGVVEVA